MSSSGSFPGSIIGSKNCTQDWSGFGQAPPGNAQNGVQQPVQSAGQPAPTYAGAAHMRPGSHTLMNAQESFA
jgi:hypothetical protein